MWWMKRAALAVLALYVSAGMSPVMAQEFQARIVSAAVDYAARLGSDLHGAIALPPDMIGRTFSAYDQACLALAIYQEARGEPRIGQRLVAHAILNRVHSSAYPDTICGVVYQNAHRRNRCQFSFACDRRCDTPKNPRAVVVALKVAAKALADDRAGKNPFPEAFETVTHYHRYNILPAWSKKLIPLGRIGDHVFFASERVIRKMVDGRQRLRMFINFLTGDPDQGDAPDRETLAGENLLALAMLEPQTSSQVPLSPAR